MDDHMSPGSQMENAGLMKMHTSFYWDYKVQLLFSGWSSQSRGAYTLSLAAVFVLALFYQWFAELKKGLMKLPPPVPPPAADPAVLARGGAPRGLTLSTTLSKSPSSKFGFAAGSAPFLQLLKDLLRKRATCLFFLTLTHVLGATCGYLLMLAIMSFNVGVFLSVLTGLAVGFILFETHHL